MADRHHHHHHRRQEKKPVYPSQAPGCGMVPEGNYGGYYPGTVATSYPSTQDFYRQEENKHKQREHAAELVVVAAGAIAWHERHQIKSDPEHAQRHKFEEDVAEGVAVAAGLYAVYEHHEKKMAHKAAEEASRNKHHHHRHGHHRF